MALAPIQLVRWSLSIYGGGEGRGGIPDPRQGAYGLCILEESILGVAVEIFPRIFLGMGQCFHRARFLVGRRGTEEGPDVGRLTFFFSRLLLSIKATASLSGEKALRMTLCRGLRKVCLMSCGTSMTYARARIVDGWLLQTSYIRGGLI